MRNERLESALTWCKKNNIESNLLKKFSQEFKKKQSKKQRRKFLTEKAENKV